MSTIITPTTGVVYKFIFETGFDKSNGIFKLVKLMTYDEYLNDGGDILRDFYVPNGKTEDDLNNDLTVIRESRIMKLQTPNELGTVSSYFAPLSHLKYSPDHNVKKYAKLGVVASIGIVDESDILDYVKTNIQEQFESALGITTDPKLVSIGDVWLTEDEYNAEVAKRDENKKKLINYFSENIKLNKEINSLKTRMKEYEKYLIHVAKVKDKQEGTDG